MNYLDFANWGFLLLRHVFLLCAVAAGCCWILSSLGGARAGCAGAGAGAGGMAPAIWAGLPQTRAPEEL